MSSMRRNGREGVLVRALVWALLAAGAILLVLPVLPTAAQSPPGSVASVTVTRADGTLTASWNAPNGATKYHVTYSSDNRASWSRAASAHTENSITISADNSKAYIVGVRAGNDHGWSGWVNSASAGPYTPTSPGPVASVTVTRDDGSLTASWNAVDGATSYHITYTSDGGQSWSLAALNHSENSITISGADNSKTYIVGVRARNSVGDSGWVNSPSAAPYQPEPTPTPTPEPTATPTPTATPDPDAGIIVQDTSGNAITALSVPEGGEASYQVKLASQPAQDVEVCIGLSVRDNNDPDITFKGEASGVVALKLDFTTENWNTPQTVTLVAAEDNDYADGARDLDHDTRTSNYFAGTVWLAVTEVDNDEPPPAAPTGLTATAGDGSVALAWNEPLDSSITGYEYQVNHNDTATGNLSGWGSWQSIASSDADTTSYTVSGLTNGKEYRFKLRAVNSGGASKPAPQSAPWYVAATPAPPPPPAAPSNVQVDPSEDSLDITWDAVTGAPGYDVRAKAKGASQWHSVASNVSDTSYTYTTSETMDYIGVRARNANGASAWTDVSRMPADDLLNVATGLSSGSASAQSGASAQSVQAQSQLATPTWGTITRRWVVHGRLDLATELDLNWTGASGATGYNVVCSDTERGGWDWYLCGWVDAANSNTVTYTSVPAAQSQPVTVSHYRRTSENFHPPGDYRLVDGRPVVLAIRAVNNTPADASAWANTPIIRSVFPKLDDLTVTRTDGQVSMSWTPDRFTTGYEVYCDNYTAGEEADYTLCATLTDQDDTDDTHSVTITNWTAGGTDYSIDNTSILDIAIDSTNAWSKGRSLVPFIHPVFTLTASEVGATTATLTISGHSGQWWYKGNAGPDSTCQGPVSAGDSTEELTGLTAHSSYDYTAYNASGCGSGDLLATAPRFTTVATVSNLANTKGSTDKEVTSAEDRAIQFTTGPHAEGFDLQSVTLTLKQKTAGGTLRVALHADSSGVPASTALATLTGTAPTSSSWTDATFTCSAAACDNLGSATTYYIVLENTANSGAWSWAWSASGNETRTLNTNGWNIGDGYVNRGTFWSAEASTHYLAQIGFYFRPSLRTGSITATGATLTLDYYNENWWYKADTGPHATCQGPVTTSAATLTGLTSGTPYTYSAYDASGCASANLLDTAPAFTPEASTLTASNIGETTARLTIGGYNGEWYYDADTGPHTTCQGPVTANTSTRDLTGLSANTTYTYEAYSASGCADTDKLATATAFTTLPGLPRNVSVANSTFDGNTRRYAVSWDKPANTEATDTFAYQVQCTTVNDKTTTSWGACGTQNVSSTANTDLSLTVSHSWSSANFRYVRVRTVKDGRNSAWVLRHTQYGTP